MTAIIAPSNGSPSARTDRAAVVATGWGIHVPNVDLTDLVPQSGYGPACTADRAYELLGRKGLLSKEPATRLALCAVHRALHREPGSPRPGGAPDPRAAVVVSSNLGNVATVHKVVRILREANVREISPLDAPNASSNVIASTIAIWFRSGGPNLMVCSGATSGLDALALGCTLLRAGRADRVLVVGVEPDDEVAARLFRENLARLGTTGELRAGAACIVLERSTETTAGMPVLGCCRPVTGSADLASLPRSTVVIGPAEMAPAGARVIDLSRRIGDLYGALGVLQLAVGSAMTEVAPADPPSEWVLICGNRIEGWLLLPVSQDVLRIRSAAS